MKNLNNMKFFFLITFLAFSGSINAQKKDGDGKIIYKYKKYEKFDFDDLSVTGEGGSPGDLSVTPRYQRDFKNKLPLRENFNPELRKALERVQ